MNSLIAVELASRRGGNVVRVATRASSEIGPHQLRIATVAAAIHPVDRGIVSGALAHRIQDRSLPLVLGWDLEGVIVEAGSTADQSRVGERVLGFSQWFSGDPGLQASEVVVSADAIARADATIPIGKLAPLGLNGLTALQVVESAAVAPGDLVVVTGANGAVGSLAIGVAADRGAVVVGVVRKDDGRASRAGAETTIEVGSRAHAQFLASNRADVVINTLPGIAAAASWLRPGGRYRSVTTVPADAPGLDALRVGVTRDARGLAEVVDLARSGRFPLTHVIDFDARQAVDAYRTAADEPRTQVVLRFR